jgi:hypothetical protein
MIIMATGYNVIFIGLKPAKEEVPTGDRAGQEL